MALDAAEIPRPSYLSRLVDGMGNGQVKVVTGIRRCGKSFLVFELFKRHLIETGVPEDHIFEMAFDAYENKPFRDPAVFYPHVLEQLHGEEMHYILLDEVQLLGDFVDVLNGLLRRRDIDVYVTGSNARLLSKDVVTEFRGRGDEIRMAPLSFSEFMTAYEGEKREGYLEYATYGGLPAVLARTTPERKADYLRSLFDEIYLRDIVEKNGVREQGNLSELTDVLASNIGSLTNPLNISNTFKSVKRTSMAPATIERYITYLEDSFLIERAQRYDIKGKRYIGTPVKYYFSDMGLRNARLGFRQVEETHLMENVIFNELRARGFVVDVGTLPVREQAADGRVRRSQLEVDFVCNKGSRRYYVQSAYALPTPEKHEQELASLLRIDDSFKKVVIVQDGLLPHYDDHGVLWMNIYDFLLDEHSLEF